MNLLANEGIDTQILDRLRSDGHKIHDIAKADASITDDDVLEISYTAGLF